MAEALAVVGLALTVPSVLEFCVNRYRSLSSTLSVIRNADAELEKYFVFCDLSFSEMEECLTQLSNMHGLSQLGPSLQDVLVRVLLQLSNLLNEFKSELESCYEKDGEGVKRWRLALISRRGFEKYQKRIDEWNERLTRRLLLRAMAIDLEAEGRARAERQEKSPEHPELQAQGPVAVPAVTAALVAKPQDHTLQPVDGSNAFLAELPDGTAVLVEYRSFARDASVQEKMYTQHTVRDIATMLCRANTRIALAPGTNPGGILKCLGYFRDEARLRYGLVSQLPSSKPPKSLQHLLWSPENAKGLRHNLNDRVGLARSIASAVLEIHAAQFVHKSIRPSNILVFDPDAPGSRGYPYAVGRPAVIGFEQTRPDWEDSSRLGSGVWEEDIYRHPDRQGLQASVPYSMLHDIYSLGVVFLEIGLWRSALAVDRQTAPPKRIHNPLFWGSLHETRCREQDPFKIAALYQKLARSVIPQTIGGRFAAVIEACLTCVEGDFGHVEDGQGNDGADEIVYLERVVEALEAICL